MDRLARARACPTSRNSFWLVACQSQTLGLSILNLTTGLLAAYLKSVKLVAVEEKTTRQFISLQGSNVLKPWNRERSKKYSLNCENIPCDKSGTSKAVSTKEILIVPSVSIGPITRMSDVEDPNGVVIPATVDPLCEMLNAFCISATVSPKPNGSSIEKRRVKVDIFVLEYETYA
jgi:hypothetical protein